MCGNHDVSNLSRRSLMAGAGTLLAASAVAFRPARAADEKPAPNAIPPSEAFEQLKQGNARYLANEPKERDFSVGRAARAEGQAPIVGVLACADSRVPPEIIFDQGPGKVFVVRDAGNVVSNYGLASLEFAVAVLNVPLILVLGHSSCGAVAAALQSSRERKKLPGHLPELVDAIQPAVERGARQASERSPCRHHQRECASGHAGAEVALEDHWRCRGVRKGRHQGRRLRARHRQGEHGLIGDGGTGCKTRFNAGGRRRRPPISQAPWLRPSRTRHAPSCSATWRRRPRSRPGILAKDLKTVPTFAPSLRSRIIVFLLGIFGPRAMRHVLSASKVRGVSVYRGKATSSGEEGAEGHPWPTSAEEVGQRHKNYGSGTLRAGVFGVNDGLVSNTCLVMGVAGAGTSASVILLTGVAGLLAGAFSMGAGEFISMLSQKEMFEHQIGQEKDELERYPKEEAEELALIYAARGIPIKEARHVANHLIQNPEKALDTLSREELGLNPDELGSPMGAAISSFLTFSVGASLPLIPYVFGLSAHGILIASLISGTALFCVGAALSLFSGRNAFLGGVRMLAIGSAAAAATYYIGSLFDAVV